jgi:hypothetical protein
LTTTSTTTTLTMAHHARLPRHRHQKQSVQQDIDMMSSQQRPRHHLCPWWHPRCDRGREDNSPGRDIDHD